ncbi:DUF2637 domain-containing protein [Actinomadura decatromicini]|uniref:DUF2637 domain-containing protein n=1 Tax=Actinomadura decatromicini TaxID=2604572 RepID=A0A5D3FY03_9ACTN|nr:DUF2637 domain-containing protein [Actinomadura decatromicini]TYK52899.1 DUF2637 domain-containing protein [Actinomadura decatromicini]
MDEARTASTPASTPAQTLAPAPFSGAPVSQAPLTRAQRVLAGAGGLFFAGLAGLGGYGSFASVQDVAEPWFGDQAWIVPAGVDLGILALVSVALLLEWLAMPMPALRWMAFAFTAATVWLNVSAAHGDATGMVMHAAMPVLFVTFIEAVRHAIRRRAGIAAGLVREGVPVARWLLAPFSTFRLWRRMVLWQITSYPRALDAEQRRRHALALLGDHYGRKWKSKAPADVVWMLRDGVMLDQALVRVTDLTAPEPPKPPEPQPVPVPAPALAPDKPARRKAPAKKAPRDQTPPDQTRRSQMPRSVATDTEARALGIIAAEPGITGAELGRRLDISARQGQRLLSRLARPAPAAAEPAPAPANEPAGETAATPAS